MTGCAGGCSPERTLPFLLLAHGHVAGTLTRDDVDAADLMRLMAGGEQFSALTDALTALPSEFGDR
jgi:simple sugar transport system ATP-binding protein